MRVCVSSSQNLQQNMTPRANHPPSGFSFQPFVSRLPSRTEAGNFFS